MKLKMKLLNVTTPILDAFGKPLMIQDGEVPRGARLGDCLLQLLSQNLVYSGKVSGLWVYELVKDINEALSKFIDLELTEERFDFLLGLVMTNKVKEPQSGKELDFWLPYVQGQLVSLFQSAISKK